MIVYRTFSGMRRAVEVTAVHEVVKNGRPGFDGVDMSGNMYWGYDDQIVPDDEAYTWIVRSNAP
jgi:hypothetical protein